MEHSTYPRYTTEHNSKEHQLKILKKRISPDSLGNTLTHLPHLCPLLCGDPWCGACVDVQHHLAEDQVQRLPMQHLPRGKQLQREDVVVKKWRGIGGLWGKDGRGKRSWRKGWGRGRSENSKDISRGRYKNSTTCKISKEKGDGEGEEVK